jgi:hypothetical protein
LLEILVCPDPRPIQADKCTREKGDPASSSRLTILASVENQVGICAWVLCTFLDSRSGNFVFGGVVPWSIENFGSLAKMGNN